MRRLAAGALALALGACGRGRASHTDTDARLMRVRGPVYLRLAERPSTELREAEAGVALADGDVLRTGPRAEAVIGFANGTVLLLGELSDLVVRELDPKSSELHLGLGHVIAKVKPLQPGQALHFHTPTALCAVRGTELAISYDGRRTSVAVFDEGHVLVRSRKRERSKIVALGPRQETSVADDAEPDDAGELKAMKAHLASLERARAVFLDHARSWAALEARPAEARLRLAAKDARSVSDALLSDAQKALDYSRLADDEVPLP